MKKLFVVLVLGFTLAINGLSHGTAWVITLEAKRLRIDKDWMELTPADIDKLSNKQADGLAKIEREMWGSENHYLASETGLASIKTKNSREFLKQASVIYAEMLKTTKTVSSNAIAVIDLKHFVYLINSLEAALDLSKVTASFVFEGSGNLINPGVDAGTLVVIPAGTAIAVHKVIPIPEKPGVSMALITYEGRDLLMLTFKDSFAN
jgi:hypothetical protein